MTFPGYHVITSADLKNDPAPEALDSTGRLKILDAAFWQQFSQPEIAYFCVTQGLYCIPTTELVAWLLDRIDGRSAIEIGSGSGVLADALGIKATDNKMQERKDIRAVYAAISQPPVVYGPNVEERDAQRAVAKYRPKVVIAAWVTHRYDPSQHWRGGNQWGVQEGGIVAAVEEYIFIGNRHVHRAKPILEQPHEEYEFPWLVSRAMSGAPNFIATWKRSA